MNLFLPVSTDLDIDELIKYHFKVRPKHSDICSIISQHHRKKLNLRQLKTKMKKLHLTRKRNAFEEDLLAIISNELGTSLAKIFVIDKLLSYFPSIYIINIAKEDVKKTVLILDPVEVEIRKHKSLNEEYMSHPVQ